jgi:hypothetical protein
VSSDVSKSKEPSESTLQLAVGEQLRTSTKANIDSLVPIMKVFDQVPPQDPSWVGIQLLHNANYELVQPTQVLEIRGIGILNIVVDLIIGVETRGPGVSCK